MSGRAIVREFQAAHRRYEREAKKRQRELERQAKDRAKLSALAQAQLEVDTFENSLEVLLSIHREQADAMEWSALASALPPVPPLKQSHHEYRARRRLAIAGSQEESAAILQAAQREDELDLQTALKEHVEEHAEWEKSLTLARRVIAGDHPAYVEAIEEYGPFAELSHIGSSLQFTVVNSKTMECVVCTKGRGAVPTQTKTLTSSGKLSVKNMPRSRFVEIYQDYVCGCVLRVTRELFALLPIETVLISATAETVDTSTGQDVERTFLSTVIPRATAQGIDYDRIDPSDTIMSLMHRGDLKASRKTGEFEFITPYSASDLTTVSSDDNDFSDLLGRVRRVRAELAKQATSLSPQSVESQ
jgi:hypothetical protein